MKGDQPMTLFSASRLRSEIDSLREMEGPLEKGLLEQQQKIVSLMDDRPDGFVLGKLRDVRIRKATQALKEGKETLISLKMTIRQLEAELQIALNREGET
jgi:hypothetical protein